MTATPLEDLLRGCALDWGHVQLFRDADGWQASVCHYRPRRDVHDGVRHADPVDALRAALIEDDRQLRDLARRYAAAPRIDTAREKLADDLLKASGFKADTGAIIEHWELA